ncbi:MAG TPA: ankyrin repeat domain-containing protein [Pseudobdellovibrionaceae bacterium]|nr:ankyrin repeat domain-containing protein [Pseudobdellovibrionaceae bacterium]
MTRLFCLLALTFSLSSGSAGTKEPAKDLFEAAARGDLSSLQRAKGRIHVKNAAGESLLIKAADAGQTKTVEWLLRNGAVLDETDAAGSTALLYAVSSGEEETALLLIEKGADLEKVYGEKKESIVFEAVRLGRNKILEKILSKKPELAKKANTDGETPLFEAVRSAQSESAKILLKKGADKNARNKKGRKAADLADPKTDSVLIQILGSD